MARRAGVDRHRGRRVGHRARPARRALDGLPVAIERHDLTATFPAGVFDLVSAQYLQSPDSGFPREEILRRAAEAVAPGGTLLVVGHGGHLPHHEGGDGLRRNPTAADVLAALGLHAAAWDVDRCESVPRVVTQPDGVQLSIPDEVVQVRRR